MSRSMRPKPRYIGNRELQNVDGADKVTGRSRYVGDMTRPGMLVAKVLRSPIPHGRIARLDVSPALDVPGVCAAITSEDFVDHGNYGWPERDNYVLAYRKVRYVGEAVAAVAAETEAAARAGIEAIEVEYESLPVVDDPARALDPESPIVPEKPATLTTGETAEGNLCDRHIVRNGDPDPLLRACPLVLDETYTFEQQEHAYLEPEGALAVPEADGGVTVYANNQSPFINRDYLVELLGLREEVVRVIQPPVGGAFGGKDDVVYETSAQAARLARITDRPVRLVLTRSESMKASYKRHGSRIHLELGVDADGHLQAARAHLLIDNGAYAAATPLASWRATVHAAGAYRYRAVQVDTDVVYTNNGYAGAFRGFGNIQAVAASEMAIDELAHRLDRDPIDFRLENCLREGDRTMTGATIDHEVGLSRCLDWVRNRSNWEEKRSRYGRMHADEAMQGDIYRGIGVAAYFHGSGLGGEGEDFAVSTLKIERDGSITLTSGLTDFGQGSRTVFTVLAAETLGVDMERIHMLRPDTHTAIDSGPTVASRASIVGGNATRIAALKLKGQLDAAAADLLNCDPDRLIRDGDQYIGPNEQPVSFDAVVDHARTMGMQLSTAGRWAVGEVEWDFKLGTGQPYFCYVFGAQVAEVQVNARTGRIRVTGLWAAHDAGTILYPQGALGQFYGGITQGLGYALTEGYTYDRGKPKATQFTRYRIPRATDVPEIDATFIETTLREGPFGAKNLAEPVMAGTAPAIANAVFHATGVRTRALPIPRDALKR